MRSLMDLVVSEAKEASSSKVSTADNDLFGDILLRRGQIRRYQLQFALDLQKAYKAIAKDMRVGDILVEHGAISDKTREDTVTLQRELPKESITQIVQAMNFEDEVTQTKRLVKA